jgi:poly-gamma-glutamate capsule biosynthesis protein CapA/YwtB (metallophosphatase superfamily)
MRLAGRRRTLCSVFRPLGRQAIILIAGAVVVGACSGGGTRVEANAGLEPASLSTGPAGTIQVSSGGRDYLAGTTTVRAPTTSTSTTVASTTTTTEAPPRRWTLLAGGDTLMDRSEPAGIDPFAGIVPSLASADIAMVNVEMAITDRGSPVHKTFVFRAPPAAAQTLAAAGVDVAVLANNHARDYGEVGLLDSIAFLTGAGVVPVGAGSVAAEAYSPAVIGLDGGISVAIISSTQIVPSGFSATSTRAGVATDRERVIANVRVAAAEHDVVIAAVHWGIERDTCPSGTQRAFARDLLAAGATAVIGHHPHDLQPNEVTDSQLVANSLGNFIWHARSGITGDTGVLQLDFEGSTLVSWKFHPHLLDGNGAPVPVESGSRHQRIVDIITGDCAKHDPPPVTTTPLTVPTTAGPTTAVPATTVAPTTTPSTVAPSTSGPPTSVTTTTAAAGTGG